MDHLIVFMVHVISYVLLFYGIAFGIFICLTGYSSFLFLGSLS